MTDDAPSPAAPDRPDDSPPTGAYESAPAPAERPGAAIGPYKLLQLVGEGGMGEVWMAEQGQPVRRRVAVKVIKAGMDSRQVVARFEAERQALALMDHPNIAKVLDAGTTDTGRPFFVMELIKGVPITRFCDEHHLTPRERLELFVPVCRAVQHAHQKGVIHRDLKPSNVLVGLSDGRPVPKVIDFGLAKATAQRLTDKTMFTEAGQIVGTLEYMAPEQAELNNLDIDTRADIYSLGVLLYELLAGSPPFPARQLRGAAFTEMLRIIREVEPPTPSTRLSSAADLPALAARRKAEPKRLARLVRGDLDWIAMKCLEKDRGRRYETANGLAVDLLRFLADEPVTAGPPSAAYRLRKFARRHRAVLATAAAVAALLVAAAAVSGGPAWRATRAEAAALAARDDEAAQRAEAVARRAEAEEQRRRAKAALDDMLSEESLAFLTTQPELLPAQRAFLERAAGHYRDFAAHAATGRAGRELEAEPHFRLGRIYVALGRWADAEAAFRASLRVGERLANEYPGEPRYRATLAATHNNLGLAVADRGRRAEAEAEFRAALALDERLAAEYPGEPAYRARLASTHGNLGLLLKMLGRRAEAEPEYRAALAVYEALAAEHPGEPAYRAAVAVGHYGLGVLLADQGRRADAAAEYRAAVAPEVRLAADHPAAREYRTAVARSHVNLALLLAGQGQRAAAEAEDRAALPLLERLAAEYPGLPEYRRNLATAHSNLGLVLADLGKRAEAEAEHRAALAGLERLAARDPAAAEYRADLARTHRFLGVLLAGQGRPADAAAEFRAAAAGYERLAAEHPDVAEYAVNLGAHALDRGDPAAALDWFAGAVAALEPVHRADPQPGKARQFLRNSHWGRARARKQLGRFAEAVADWDRALALDDGSGRAALRLGRAITLAAAGDVAPALAAADELARAWPAPPVQRYNLACVYALAAAKLPPADAGRAAAKAVGALRQAAAAGLAMPHLLADPDLAAVRGRADFAELLWDLADAAK